MFSSLARSVTKLSPKALLSRYIAKSLAAFFDVDLSLIETNLLHDTHVTLRDIYLKEQHVTLGGGQAVVVVGRVDSVKFSWTWNTSSSTATKEGESGLITNVALVISGVRFRVMPSEKEENTGTNTIETFEAIDQDVDTAGKEGEPTQDWKARYLQQIVNHLTLRVTELEIVLDLQSPRTFEKKPPQDTLSVALLGNSMELVSLGRQYATDPSPTSMAPSLTQRLSVGSIAAFVIPQKASSQANDKESLITVEFDDTPFWKREDTRQAEQHKGVSNILCYPLLEPFTYSALVTRITGRRFLDGILMGLEVTGEKLSLGNDNEAKDAITVHAGVVQTEAFRRLQNLLMTAENTPDCDAAELPSAPALGPNPHPTISPSTSSLDSVLSYHSEVSTDEEGYMTPQEENGPENDARRLEGWNSSTFVLPIRSMAVVLPNKTELRLDGCTFQYRTDGKLCSLSGTGGILVDNVHIMECNKWVVNAVKSEIRMERGKGIESQEMPVVARVICRPEQIRKVVKSVNQILSVYDDGATGMRMSGSENHTQIPNKNETTPIPWSSKADGIVAIQAEGLNPEECLSLDLMSPQVSYNANDSDIGYDFEVAGARVLSSSSSAVDIRVPPVVTRNNGLFIDGDVDIEFESTAAIEKVQNLVSLIVDSVQVEDTDYSSGGLFIPITVKQIKVGISIPHPGSFCAADVHGERTTWSCSDLVLHGFRGQGFTMKAISIQANLGGEKVVNIGEIGTLSAPDYGHLSSPLNDSVVRYKNELHIQLQSVDATVLGSGTSSPESPEGKGPLDNLQLPFPVAIAVRMMTLKTPPSDAGEVQEIACSGIEASLRQSSGGLPDGSIRIQAIAKLTLPGIGALSSPTHRCTILLQDDALKFHVPKAKTMILSGNISEEANAGNVASNPVNVQIPFPVSFFVGALEITSSSSVGGSMQEFFCSNVQATLKPSSGRLPDGSIKISEISKLVLPGFASLSHPVLDTSILFKDNTVNLLVEALNVVKLGGSSTPSADRTDTSSLCMQVPLSIRIAIQSLAVASSLPSGKIVEELKCGKVQAFLKPSSTRLPDSSIQIHEISTLLLPGVMRLSSPLINSAIQIKDDHIKVHLDAVNAVKLRSSSEVTKEIVPSTDFEVVIPFPVSVAVETMEVTLSLSPGEVMQGISCKRVQANVKPSSGKLPYGSVRIQEVSTLNVPGGLCLSSPLLDAVILLCENGSVKVHLGTVRATNLSNQTASLDNDEAASPIDAQVPFPICVVIEALKVESGPSANEGAVELDCSRIQVAVKPSSDRLPEVSAQIHEISRLVFPGIACLSSPLLDTTVLMKNDSLQLQLRSVEAIMLDSSTTTEDVSQNELKMKIPFPIRVAIETVAVTSSLSSSGRIQEFVCRNIEANTKPSSQRIPDGYIRIHEISKATLPGLVSLSSPVLDSSITVKDGAIFMRLQSVLAVVENCTASKSESSSSAATVQELTLPFPLNVTVKSYVSVQFRGCPVIQFCGFGLAAKIGLSRGGALELDNSRVFLPPFRFAFQEITEVDVPGILTLHSPVKDATINFGNNKLQARISTLEVTVFQQASVSSGAKTTDVPSLTELKTPVSFEIEVDGLGVRSCPSSSGASEEVFSCRYLRANGSPSSGLFLDGDVEVSEITTCRSSELGLYAPIQSAIVCIRNDTMAVDLTPIVLRTFDLPVSYRNGSQSQSLTNIPLAITITIPSLVIRDLQNCMARSQREYLSIKGIVAVIEPSPVSSPKAVIKVEEVTSLNLSAGYLSAPISNLIATSSGGDAMSSRPQVTVKCSSIAAVKNGVPMEGHQPQPKATPIELPCTIQLDVEKLSIQETGGLDGLKDWITVSNFFAEASPMTAGTPIPTGNGHVMDGSIVLRVRQASVVEIRKILRVADIIVSAVVHPDRPDVVHGLVVSVGQAALSADFKDVNWSDALIPAEGKSQRELLFLPYAQIGPIESCLKYKGVVLSLKEAKINFKKFVGAKNTNSDDVAQHYINIVKSRIPDLLVQLEILGANVGDSTMMAVGRAALGATTASGCAVGSVVGVSIRDGISGVITSGKKSRGGSEGDQYEFGDISRGLVRSVAQAAKSGARMRGDDKYIVGDFTAGTAEATGRYVSQNTERLSTAGGSGIGLAVGAAFLGPVGMVAGAYLGGQAAGSAARQCKSRQPRELQDEKATNSAKLPATSCAIPQQHESRQECAGQSFNVSGDPVRMNNLPGYQPQTSKPTSTARERETISNTDRHFNSASLPLRTGGGRGAPKDLLDDDFSGSTDTTPVASFSERNLSGVPPADRMHEENALKSSSRDGSRRDLSLLERIQMHKMRESVPSRQLHLDTGQTATTSVPSAIFAGGNTNSKLTAPRPLETTPAKQEFINTNAVHSISPPPTGSRPPGSRLPRPAGTSFEPQPNHLAQQIELGVPQPPQTFHDTITSGAINHESPHHYDRPGADVTGSKSQKPRFGSQDGQWRGSASRPPVARQARGLAPNAVPPTNTSKSSEQQEQEGYRFGDVTRGILARGKQKRGQDKNSGYKFGDFSRGLFG